MSYISTEIDCIFIVDSTLYPTDSKTKFLLSRKLFPRKIQANYLTKSIRSASAKRLIGYKAEFHEIKGAHTHSLLITYILDGQLKPISL